MANRTLIFLIGFCIAVCILNPEFGYTQQYQWLGLPNSPNPVGSGARALGMGGAFIGVADDATAASWNPGGLIQLKKTELSVAGASLYRTETNEFKAYPDASGRQGISGTELNYLSFAYPFNRFRRNMIVSLNYQHLFDFNREWHFPLRFSSGEQSIHFQQKGGLSAVGIAYCIQVTPEFSLGITLNIWKNKWSKNKWEQIEHRTRLSDGTEFFTSNRYMFDGFNANMGMLWNIDGKLALGAVFKTPFTADLKHEVIQFSPGKYYNPSENETLDMPMSYGIGLAYRFSDNLTISGDIYRTEWQDFVLKDSRGNNISLVTGLAAEKSNIDPACQVRIGAEYLFIREKYIIPLRCGFFYDPAPAQARPDDFFGMCFGSGISIGSYVFDFACQYRFGKDVGKSALQHMDFSQDIEEYTFYASVIYHF
ncbi:MAG: hypothetical protein GY795_12530 [Desulfobacterales bacterium]|nr:hypothetical protein [Desulfobacterales bacterium]